MSKKEKIAEFMKLFLLIFVMVFGFFFIYAFAWHLVGLPLTKWVILLCCVLSGLSEFGYVRWCMEG